MLRARQRCTRTSRARSARASPTCLAYQLRQGDERRRRDRRAGSRSRRPASNSAAYRADDRRPQARKGTGRFLSDYVFFGHGPARVCVQRDRAGRRRRPAHPVRGGDGRDPAEARERAGREPRLRGRSSPSGLAAVTRAPSATVARLRVPRLLHSPRHASSACVPATGPGALPPPGRLSLAGAGASGRPFACMRTTLKRGVGRGAGLNGENGHAVFPPGPASAVVRYRSRLRPSGAASGSWRGSCSGRCSSSLAVGLAVAGGAFLWFHQSVSAVHAHSVDVKIAQKELERDAAGPGGDRARRRLRPARRRRSSRTSRARTR